MHKEFIACEKPVTAAGVSILPVVKLSLTGLHTGDSVHFYAVKQPKYIVVRRAGETAIYDMLGEAVPISRAGSEYPELKRALAEQGDFPLSSDS